MKSYYIAIIAISIIIQIFSIFNNNWSKTDITISNVPMSIKSSLYIMSSDSSSYNSFLMIIFGIIIICIGIVLLFINNNYAFVAIGLGSLFSIIACIMSIININKINNDMNNSINLTPNYSTTINLKNPFLPKPTIPTSILKNIKQNAISDNISTSLKPDYCLYLNLISSISTLLLSIYIFKTDIYKK